LFKNVFVVLIFTKIGLIYNLKFKQMINGVVIRHDIINPKNFKETESGIFLLSGLHLYDDYVINFDKDMKQDFDKVTNANSILDHINKRNSNLIFELFTQMGYWEKENGRKYEKFDKKNARHKNKHLVFATVFKDYFHIKEFKFIHIEKLKS
jgi:hypothetical protein